MKSVIYLHNFRVGDAAVGVSIHPKIVKINTDLSEEFESNIKLFISTLRDHEIVNIYIHITIDYPNHGYPTHHKEIMFITWLSSILSVENLFYISEKPYSAVSIGSIYLHILKTFQFL